MRAKFINENFKEDSDPIEDMGIGLEIQMRKKIKEFDILAFIYFIDKNFPDIRKKYRDERASYDDTFYNEIPYSELEQYGIKKYMLKKIFKNTDAYDGWMLCDEHGVSMGGGS